MPRNIRKRVVNLYIKPGTFAFIFRRLTGQQQQEYEFSDLADLRKTLTNEKAKIINIIKEKKPESIYDLAKILSRDFKSVREDVKLLERFGIIELKKEIKGRRKSLKPIIAVDSLQVNLFFE